MKVHNHDTTKSSPTTNKQVRVPLLSGLPSTLRLRMPALLLRFLPFSTGSLSPDVLLVRAST